MVLVVLDIHTPVVLYQLLLGSGVLEQLPALGDPSVGLALVFASRCICARVKSALLVNEALLVFPESFHLEVTAQAIDHQQVFMSQQIILGRKHNVYVVGDKPLIGSLDHFVSVSLCQVLSVLVVAW